MTASGTKRDLGALSNVDVNVTQEETISLCMPLPETPIKSPKSKKLCGAAVAKYPETEEDVMEESKVVTNADILRAIGKLNQRFSIFEVQIKKNTADIAEVREEVHRIEFQMKMEQEKVKELESALKRKDAELREKIQEGERYSRRWNLRLANLPERRSEDVRHEVMALLAQIAPNEENKLGFLVDTIHRVGRPREDGSIRPVIIQFNMRTFRDKIWKASRNHDVMKKRNLRFAEDLTRYERECRDKLWPMVEQARKDNKKTRWKGSVVFIDDTKFTADDVEGNVETT